MNFADLTTLRVGGPIGSFVEPASAEELVDAVRGADASGTEVLVLGGGSNLVVGDDGFDGLVVSVAQLTGRQRAGDTWEFSAGVQWDAAVRSTVESGCTGLEALSGIPGTVGGAPIQNVGAYGALTSDVLSSVRVYDRETDAIERWKAEHCEFGRHRSSVFKRSRRWVILDVQFGLSASPDGRPVAYQALADELQVEIGTPVPAPDVRAAVLALRARRGMVLDAADHDTWSVGSFFLNPVLPSVPPAAADGPQWPDVDGVKLSAAWLIENAGFPKGYGGPLASLSTKHTLAITNRGGASAADILALAGEIRAGVAAKYGVVLEPECHLINCAIPASP
jgi:UDP-N-acetylmuramate dehydrogenase